MNFKNTVLAGAMVCLMASPAFADTFAGKLVYKNADGEIAVKKGEVELTPTLIESVKMKIEGVENLSEKVKVKKFEGENRTIVLAVFRNVRDMPADAAIIVKGSMLEGSNGKLFYGDVLARTCKKEDAPKASIETEDSEDSFLDRLLEGVQELQDDTGCSTEYKGGILLAHKNEAAQQD